MPAEVMPESTINESPFVKGRRMMPRNDGKEPIMVTVFDPYLLANEPLNGCMITQMIVVLQQMDSVLKNFRRR